jgi:hypothetical protein
MTEDDEQPAPPEPEATPLVVLTPPAGQDALVSESRIEPRAPEHEPDRGTKMFVTFFLLLIPPLGIVLLGAVIWQLYKHWMST